MKQCDRCRQSLPLDDFYRSTRSSDGLQARCKVCQRASKREKIAAVRAERRSAITSDLKFCPRCHEDKQLTEFHGNRAAADGRQTYCKPCSNEIRKEYVARNAEAIALRVAEKR